jgi:two-component system sensor histidine kinase UhpB
MSDRLGALGPLRRHLSGFTICARIAIGNAAIIAIGVTAGIFLARSFPQVTPLILLVIVGLAIASSYAVTRIALRPLRMLRSSAERARLDLSRDNTPIEIPNPDPETCLVASTLADLITQLESTNRQLKAVRSRAIGAQEEERKRIARWLHDDTSQALAILILQLERLERQVPDYETEICDEIRSARELAAHTLGELRKIIHGLRPSILDDLGLVPAIRWYARSTLEETGIQTSVQVEDEPFDLPPELTITLFRIAQEAINNISHHSQAEHATITLRQAEGDFYLAVEDDGRGFQVVGDPEEAIRRRHWGIIGIQERLERVGGSYNLISEPGRGTLLEVFVPLSERREMNDEQKNPHPVG